MTAGITAELSELIALKRFTAKGYARNALPTAKIGNHSIRMRGRGMEFSDLRHYQAGDEIRHMEWRITAKTGRPHVKVYQEEKERPLVLVTDFSPSMYFGTRVALKSVIAARLSALIAWTAIKQGDRIGGLFYSATTHHDFMPRARDSGVLALLDALSHYTKQQPVSTSAAFSLNDELGRLRRVAKPGSLIILISDFYQLNENSAHQLLQLRQHNRILAYHICDSLELAPPKPALYTISNGVSQSYLDTTYPKVQQSYQDWCHQRVTTINSLFKRLAIPCHQTVTTANLALLVKSTFLGGKYG